MDKSNYRRRVSILKRQSIVEESSPTETFTLKNKRKISFSGKKSVKEFCAGENAETIWGTSYEESANSPGSRSSEHTTSHNNASYQFKQQQEITPANVSRQQYDNKENAIYNKINSEIALNFCRKESLTNKAVLTNNSHIPIRKLNFHPDINISVISEKEKKNIQDFSTKGIHDSRLHCTLSISEMRNIFDIRDDSQDGSSITLDATEFDGIVNNLRRKHKSPKKSICKSIDCGENFNSSNLDIDMSMGTMNTTKGFLELENIIEKSQSKSIDKSSIFLEKTLINNICDGENKNLIFNDNGIEENKKYLQDKTRRDTILKAEDLDISPVNSKSNIHLNKTQISPQNQLIFQDDFEISLVNSKQEQSLNEHSKRKTILLNEDLDAYSDNNKKKNFEKRKTIVFDHENLMIDSPIKVKNKILNVKENSDDMNIDCTVHLFNKNQMILKKRQTIVYDENIELDTSQVHSDNSKVNEKVNPVDSFDDMDLDDLDVSVKENITVNKEKETISCNLEKNYEPFRNEPSKSVIVSTTNDEMDETLIYSFSQKISPKQTVFDLSGNKMNESIQSVMDNFKDLDDTQVMLSQLGHPYKFSEEKLCSSIVSDIHKIVTESTEATNEERYLTWDNEEHLNYESVHLHSKNTFNNIKSNYADLSGDINSENTFSVLKNKEKSFHKKKNETKSIYEAIQFSCEIPSQENLRTTKIDHQIETTTDRKTLCIPIDMAIDTISAPVSLSKNQFENANSPEIMTKFFTNSKHKNKMLNERKTICMNADISVDQQIDNLYINKLKNTKDTKITATSSDILTQMPIESLISKNELESSFDKKNKYCSNSKRKSICECVDMEIDEDLTVEKMFPVKKNEETLHFSQKLKNEMENNRKNPTNNILLNSLNKIIGSSQNTIAEINVEEEVTNAKIQSQEIHNIKLYDDEMDVEEVKTCQKIIQNEKEDCFTNTEKSKLTKIGNFFSDMDLENYMKIDGAITNDIDKENFVVYENSVVVQKTDEQSIMKPEKSSEINLHNLSTCLRTTLTNNSSNFLQKPDPKIIMPKRSFQMDISLEPVQNSFNQCVENTDQSHFTNKVFELKEELQNVKRQNIIHKLKNVHKNTPPEPPYLKRSNTLHLNNDGMNLENTFDKKENPEDESILKTFKNTRKTIVFEAGDGDLVENDVVEKFDNIIEKSPKNRQTILVSNKITDLELTGIQKLDDTIDVNENGLLCKENVSLETNCKNVQKEEIQEKNLITETIAMNISVYEKENHRSNLKKIKMNEIKKKIEILKNENINNEFLQNNDKEIMQLSTLDIENNDEEQNNFKKSTNKRQTINFQQQNLLRNNMDISLINEISNALNVESNQIILTKSEGEIIKIENIDGDAKISVFSPENSENGLSFLSNLPTPMINEKSIKIPVIEITSSSPIKLTPNKSIGKSPRKEIILSSNKSIGKSPKKEIILRNSPRRASINEITENFSNPLKTFDSFCRTLNFDEDNSNKTENPVDSKDTPLQKLKAKINDTDSPIVFFTLNENGSKSFFNINDSCDDDIEKIRLSLVEESRSTLQNSMSFVKDENKKLMNSEESNEIKKKECFEISTKLRRMSLNNKTCSRCKKCRLSMDLTRIDNFQLEPEPIKLVDFSVLNKFKNLPTIRDVWMAHERRQSERYSLNFENIEYKNNSLDVNSKGFNVDNILNSYLKNLTDSSMKKIQIENCFPFKNKFETILKNKFPIINDSWKLKVCSLYNINFIILTHFKCPTFELVIECSPMNFENVDKKVNKLFTRQSCIYVEESWSPSDKLIYMEIEKKFPSDISLLNKYSKLKDLNECLKFFNEIILDTIENFQELMKVVTNGKADLEHYNDKIAVQKVHRYYSAENRLITKSIIIKINRINEISIRNIISPSMYEFNTAAIKTLPIGIKFVELILNDLVTYLA